jgi:hypothetical protein
MATSRTKTKKVYVPIESFTIDIDGAPVQFQENRTHVAEGHPVLKGREHLFREMEIEFDWEGQTATSTRS